MFAAIVVAVIFFGLFYYLSAPFAFAQGEATINPNIPGIQGQQKSTETPEGIIANIYQFSLMVGGLLAMGAIVYGSLKYILAAGNPSGQGDARDQITQALLGLLLLVSAYLILNVLNPDLVTLKLPTLEALKESPISSGTAEPPNGTCNPQGNTGNNGCTTDRPFCCITPITSSGYGCFSTACGSTTCSNPSSVAQQYNVPFPVRDAPQLTTLINCIRSRPEVRGINLGSAATFDQSHPLCNYARGQRLCDSACSHAVGSCHYGGSNGTQGALAVDFGLGGGTVTQAQASALSNAARACDSGAFVLNEGDHVHISPSACAGN